MSGYTLKLDLTDYQHSVLIALLVNDLERCERDELTDSSWYKAIASIREDITGYDAEVKAVKEMNALGQKLTFPLKVTAANKYAQECITGYFQGQSYGTVTISEHAVYRNDESQHIALSKWDFYLAE